VHYGLALKCLAYESLRLVQNPGDDPSDLKKKAVIKAALKTDRIISAIGSKEGIKAFPWLTLTLRTAFF
jgi:hypothetical protein